MDPWGLGSNDGSLNFHESFNSLLWDQAENTPALNPNESVSSNQSFSFYPPVWDKDQYWAHFFQDGFAENHEKREEISEEEVVPVIRLWRPTQVAAPILAWRNKSQKYSVQKSNNLVCLITMAARNLLRERLLIARARPRRGKEMQKKDPNMHSKPNPAPIHWMTASNGGNMARKLLKAAPHPRSYYKCSENNCGVKKRVERDPSDREVLITTYEGNHNHKSPCPTEIYCITDPMLAQPYPLIL
ncbi:hypothetical protein KI387_034799, partial [Taxus chinensis]